MITQSMSLLIRTSTGELWRQDNDNHNILPRKPPEAKDGGLAVEVLVENQPTNAYEHAGLVWYYDDDNYAMLNKENVGKSSVQLVSEKDADHPSRFSHFRILKIAK